MDIKNENKNSFLTILLLKYEPLNYFNNNARYESTHHNKLAHIDTLGMDGSILPAVHRMCWQNQSNDIPGSNETSHEYHRSICFQVEKFDHLAVRREEDMLPL